MKFSMTFDNADPKHARVNPLRARKDRPHIWFEEGYWRVCPRPIKRRQPQGFNPTQWDKAHLWLSYENARISGATHLRWTVTVSTPLPLPDDAFTLIGLDGRAYRAIPLPPRGNIVND